MRRLGRPAVGIVPALLLFYRITAGPGEQKSHISTPLDMFRFRLFFKIRFTYSIAGNIRRQGRCRSARAFRRTTFFTNFHIFPRTGQCAFPSGNSGQSAFPVRFFCCTVSDGPGCPPFGGMHGGRRNGQGLRRRQPVAVFPSRPSETIRYIPYRERPFAGLWVSTNAPPQRVSLSSQGRVSP